MYVHRFVVVVVVGGIAGHVSNHQDQVQALMLFSVVSTDFS